ncbi:hypothetical protein A0H81_00058 [Grifola frondosa]|uniref:Zn(2)-C6 fungal-type domain-containing protein n=1 Tax=Grifola frondosa TaxID=5627 RepID=A0A1C7MS40_GRIFR|nr:hypothetical protein A0H81_00058 [Grifola frondosa]
MFVAGSSAQPNQTPRALHPAQQSATQPSWSLSGSLDPVTGVFQRTPEHPRMRTAQACEKCRIRKAKCSGDHPSCQRCTARGLQCEYAPERKMRGPNKTKRKSISVHDRQGASPSGRRMSLASSSSSSDEVGSGLEFVDIPLAVAATAAIPVSPHDPTPSPLSAHMSPPDSFHRDVPGPLDFSINHAHVLAMPPMSHDDAAQQQRARLPSIELGDAAIYPQAFHQFVGSDPTFVSDIMQDDSSTQGSRRSSLPAYLLESYSRIALAAHPMDHGALVDPSTFAAHSIADAMDTIRSTSQESSHEMSPRDALSLYSHPRSSSSASATSPITPISLPEVGYENPGELAYPLQYPDEFGDELGVEAPQHSESPPVELQIPEPYRPKSPFAWVHTDVDTEAPTAADNEKSMEELESMSSQP